MDQDRVYFEKRERIERAAATSASDDRARQAHEELANGYAALARNGSGSFATRESQLAVPHVTIITR